MLKLISDRKIIKITGPDNKKLLQGLITNDIEKAKDNLIYSAMLNNKGRFLYDFFIFESKDMLFIDCHKDRIDEIIKKLSFYKLRSKVEITKDEELKVFFSDNNTNKPSFIDPRNKNLGYRIYHNQENCEDGTDQYHQKRIELKIPDGEYDLTFEKSLILEFNFDNLSAISYEKGCYIGQELTARTHHTGQIRKKLYFVKIDKNITIEKNTKIKRCDNNNCGIILSSFIRDNCFYALALIKDECMDLSHDFTVEGEQLNIIQ
ncbi:MAG: folate-binding protein YgfZ [Rickettsiales bacterium]|nr:folate-binding protein YgfZ [Rickettsiales bacterium]